MRKRRHGQERAGAGVLKARFGLPWPRWAERRRRAATLRATRDHGLNRSATERSDSVCQ